MEILEPHAQFLYDTRPITKRPEAAITEIPRKKRERQPHKLEASKTMHSPRRMIFFDTESQVDISITDDEIDRAREAEKVTKEHAPYLVCSRTWEYNSRDPSRPYRKKQVYHARDIPGVGTFPEGSDSFLSDFYHDVDAFARPAETTYIYAHNAKYDILVSGAMYYLVTVLGYTCEGFSDSNPFILTLEKVVRTETRLNKKTGRSYEQKIKKTLEIISSTNYYATSLKQLGKVFNLEKLDFAHGVPFTLPSAITYCDRDVEILEAAILAFVSFVRREGLGSLAKTAAGQAFAAFKHRFLGDKTIWIHNTQSAIDVERRAYCGGRVEVLKQIGRIQEKLFYVDVNSMYPYVMKTYLYPTKLITEWKTCSIERLKEAIQDGFLICADVRVKTSFPVFAKKQERLIFPVGDFETTLCTPELIYALNHDLLVSVENVCVYESDDIFSGYVDYFYNKRLDAKRNKDKVHDYLYKLFMNCLYGKFGQKIPPWEQFATADPSIISLEMDYDREHKRMVHIKTFGGKVFRRTDDMTSEESQDSFPAIAAHVTSYARMLLLEYIEMAGWENVYYCDTDSLFVTAAGYEKLRRGGVLDDKKLGGLKLEDSGYLEAFGCKDYVFHGLKFIVSNDKGEKQTFKQANIGKQKPAIRARRIFRPYSSTVKIKGVSKNAVKLPNTPEGLLQFAVTQWTGFTERLKVGDFQGYYTKVIIKTLKREYNKGNVDLSGRVTPYKLDFAKEVQAAYEAMLQEGVNDLYVNDPIRFYVRQHGAIKRPQKGQRFYGEYQDLPRAAKVKYFRMDGLPLDVWCDGVGWAVNDLLDKLNDVELKMAYGR